MTNRPLWMISLGLYLIVVGALALTNITVQAAGLIMAVWAIITGVLVLANK